jgi:hypothetical protein
MQTGLGYHPHPFLFFFIFFHPVIGQHFEIGMASLMDIPVF